MMPSLRRDRLLRFIRDRGAASIGQLVKAIGVSESTVRRDIDQLAAEGVLLRSPGGVMSPDRHLATFEPAVAETERASAAEKTAIGVLAAARIGAGQCVLFDTGTTARAAARALIARAIAITAVTIDLETAVAFARAGTVTLIVPGGTLRPGSFSLLGAPGLSFLRGMHVDLALMGAHAITDGIVTETSVELAEMKAAVLERARRAVLLADATKFRAPALRTVAPLSAFHELVTDARIDAAARAQVAAAGVAVTVVGQ